MMKMFRVHVDGDAGSGAPGGKESKYGAPSARLDAR